MSTDKDLALIVRDFFYFLDVGETLNTLELARVIVFEFEQLGDRSRTVAGVSAIIRVEAAASGVSYR
jgi:hypothetical protein